MSSAFADTHNMVAILTKSDAGDGFDQILDFLKGSYIKYALTVNPHIYVSCIKQFWNTVTVKQSNDVTMLQALVDKKKVLISEASLSAKRTSWNEFSSTMASEVICLSTGVALMGEKEEEKKAEEVKVISDDKHVKGRQAEIYQIDMDHAAKVLSIQEEEPKVQEVVEVVTTAKLITEVVTAASAPVSTASTIIPAAKSNIPAVTITAAPVKVDAASTRRRRGVGENTVYKL
nr:hypothetical protein [Tanacetum cinerariifolium]